MLELGNNKNVEAENLKILENKSAQRPDDLISIFSTVFFQFEN